MDSTVLASHGDVTGRPGAAVAAALAALPPSELVSARKAGTGDAAAPTPTASAASTEPLGLTDVVDALEAHLQDSEHRDTPLHKRVELKRILECAPAPRPHACACTGSLPSVLHRAYDHSLMEWKRFCMFDEFKYTRNLVATDNETYTLMLLCWSPGQARCVVLVTHPAAPLCLTCHPPPMLPPPPMRAAPSTTTHAMAAG